MICPGRGDITNAFAWRKISCAEGPVTTDYPPERDAFCASTAQRGDGTTGAIAS
jgi:hypothetical protein